MIRAYWHGKPNSNFGDVLTPLLIEAISGQQVQFAEIDERDKFLVCGSIIKAARPGDVLWGTGGLYPGQFDQIPPGVYCLMARGPLTRECLRKEGIKTPEYTCEPSVLLPFILPPKGGIEKLYEIAVFPHICFYNSLKENPSGYKIFSVSDPPRTIVDIISQSEVVVTESLHIMIVAEALGIPTVFMQTTTNHDYDFTWKFRDYYLSTEREFINPFIWDGATAKQEIQARLASWNLPAAADYSTMLSLCPFNTRNISDPSQLIPCGV